MPSSLNAEPKPGWWPRLTRGIAARIDPEHYQQEQGMNMTKYGLIKRQFTKAGVAQFGEVNTGNQFMIEQPGAGVPVNPTKALESFKGFVYAAANAKAREVMTIDWRLFAVDGEDTEEQKDHDLLDLLDSPNDNMNGLELKYLTSALLDLTGNTYWWLEGVNNETDKPTAIHLMPSDRVVPVVDRRSWPYQLVGYKMKLPNIEMSFKPYEIVHFRLPNPSNFFEGYSPVMAGAAYIDNDNDATRFNSNFFKNGARPAGFLESEFVADSQLESLRVGFASMHEGVDNMNRIGVLPKGVKWAQNGSTPKDMDFKGMSLEMKDRILSMFGVSKTILGTAESDTNRATAETADYVFSKRVVKPWMILICGTLNDRLVGRYGDDLYASFIDPVPEDKAARTTEMTTSVGGQPILTVNEAREQFMGAGPVDGGDVLMAPTAMAPAGQAHDPSDAQPQPEDDPNAKRVSKAIEFNREKSINGVRVGYRPSRTKFQRLATKRKTQAKSLAEKIIGDLRARLAIKSKAFVSTKEQDEAAYQEASKHTLAAEQEVTAMMRRLNAEQQKEVLANLDAVVAKSIDPTKLFGLDNWISITTNAILPILEGLSAKQAAAALAAIGDVDSEPYSDLLKASVHESVEMMADSYNKTTLEALESKINDGLQEGESLADITKRVEEIYEWSDNSRAGMVAKTESFRTTNDALKTAWKQSGVVKTVRWFTSALSNVCDYCQEMNGKTIGIDDVFFKNGDSFTTGEGENAKTMSLDYGDVGAPPLHPLCACFVRPAEVSI